MEARRRHWLKAGAASVLAGLAGCAIARADRTKARVVVVGGGYGGATAAKYLSRLDSAIDVVLVEPGAGGLSRAMNEQEARFARDWARNIWSDTLA